MFGLSQFGYQEKSFTDKGCLNINKLNWLNIIQNYIDMFGDENVLALPYEMLRDNPGMFLEKFYCFSDLEEYYPGNFSKINARFDYQ